MTAPPHAIIAVMASITERLAAFFASQPSSVLSAYLYGSHARGAAAASSDVDVAVLYDAPPPATLDGPRLTLQSELERQLHCPVDVVVINTASADLVHRILRDGVLVLDRNRPARLRFEVARRNEYFDLEPIRREYRRGRRDVPAS